MRYLSLLILLLLAAPAAAHQVSLDAVADGRTIRGQALAQGEPLAGATVTAYDPAGRTLGRAVTDAAGRFTLDARGRTDHRLVLTGDQGHAAEALLPAEAFPADLPAGGGHPSPPLEEPASAAELRALAQQIADLRLELRRSQRQVRVGDVLGGLGWIAGLAGVTFYFLGRRRVAHP